MTSRYGNDLTKKLIYRIILSTFVYTGIFILVWILARAYCNLIVWQADDTEYLILKSFENVFVITFVWLIGVGVIFFYHMRKTLSYIDAIVHASYLLSGEDNDWINLPQDLHEIEKSFNQIKQTSIQNYRLAREMEKRKNDLVVYLAHDIKTPLTSMIGYLSLLDEIDDMPFKQRNKYIKIALDKSYKLEELINELFDIARFNSHEISLDKEELNLNLMLEQIVDDFYPILSSVNKKIKMNVEDKIVLNGDSDKLARVFNNVINNAIYYSRDASVIDIDVSKRDEEACVVISNQGRRISEEKLKKLFDKFYRVDESRSSRTGGSGLGLAIAKEIVELHHGSIYATSEGEEIKFYIHIPLN